MAKTELKGQETAGVKKCKDALDLVVGNARAKFDESVDLGVVLGIDGTKGDQTVRGSVLLPHGTGKKTRVIVFARGEHEKKAIDAGADFVGAEDLIEKISGGWLEFDAAVATPDMMGLVGKVARILGPRNLIPNNKLGTITFDVATVVRELKQGRVSFRNDKGGVLHAPFGKVSFGPAKLEENLRVLLKAVVGCKPATAKGKFVRKVTISSTMGPGVTVSPEDCGVTV